MKLTDKYNTFSSAQQVTTDASPVVSSNVLDLVKATGNNPGGGAPLTLLVEIDTVTTAGTSPALTVTIQECATESGTYTDVVSREFSAMTKGTKLSIPLPDNVKQYVGLEYAMTGADADYKVNAALIHGHGE